MHNKLIISFLVVLATSLTAQNYQSIKTSGAPELKLSEEKGALFIQSKSAGEKKPAVSYAWRVLKKDELAQDANTLTFEVQADGSDFYGSVMLGASKFLLNAHEATFTLKSKEWQKISIPLDEFCRNQKPWSIKKMDGSALMLKQEMIKFIGFGRGFQFNKYDHPNYSFKIRNIKFVQTKIPNAPPLAGGLSRLKEKLQKGEAVKVLLLGDSITDMGKSESHTFHAFEELKKKFSSQVTVCNMAIGGHSVRGANIVLPRSLAKLPSPDLTVIFFGANDCKSITPTSGFSAKIFSRQLERLIQRVNRLSGGSSEFLLINGVPRLDKKKVGVSTGLVEKLAPAYTQIAEEHKLILCDTLGPYNKLNKSEKELYYKDTVHQDQPGLKFLGSLIAETILNKINAY